MKHHHHIYTLIAFLLLVAEMPFLNQFYTSTRTNHEMADQSKGVLASARKKFIALHASPLLVVSDPQNEIFSKAKAFFEASTDKPLFHIFKDSSSQTITTPLWIDFSCLPCHGNPMAARKSIKNLQHLSGLREGDFAGVLYQRIPRATPPSFGIIAIHLVVFISGLAILIAVHRKSRKQVQAQVRLLEVSKAQEQERLQEESKAQAHAQEQEQEHAQAQAQLKAQLQEITETLIQVQAQLNEKSREIEQIQAREREEAENKMSKKYRVRIYTFGEFSLFIDDKPMNRRDSIALNILRVLIASEGIKVPWMDIADEVWGQKEREIIMKEKLDNIDGDKLWFRFDQNIRRFNGKIGFNIIRFERNLVSVNEKCFVDALEFNALLQRLKKEKRINDFERMVGELKKLCKGLFLPGYEGAAIETFRNKVEKAMIKYGAPNT